MNSIVLGAGVVALAGLSLGLVLARRSMFGREKDAWLKTLVGLLFLDVLAAIAFLAESGLADAVPYLRDEMLRMSLTSICLVGGALFTAAGFIGWLPQLRQAMPNFERTQDLVDLVGDIQMVCSWKIPPDRIVAEVAERIFSTIKPKALVYLIWEERRNLLSPVQRFPEDLVLSEFMLSMIEADDWLRDPILRGEPTRRVVGRDAISAKDDIPFPAVNGDLIVTIPVVGDGNLFGVFVMSFPDEKVFRDSDITALQPGISALGASIRISRLQRSYETFAGMKDAHTRLLRMALEGDNVSDLLADGIKQLRLFVPFDMLSIAVLDEHGTSMKRYSVVESGNKVSERGLSWPIRDTVVEHVLLTEKSHIENKLTGITYRDDAWLSKCGFRSRLSVPIFAADRVVGAAVYASMREGAFDEECEAGAELLSDAFAVAIRNALIREKLKRWSHHVRDSFWLLSRLAANGNTEEFFEVFSRQITAGMPVTCCRVSMYNRDADTLRIVTEHSLRSDTKSTNRRGREMPLGRMPHHLSVVHSAKPVMENAVDLDATMSAEEISNGFPDRIRSAIILPLIVGGTVRGIMSLGEARDPKRRSFASEDLAFAQMRAAQACLAIAVAEDRVGQSSVIDAGDSDTAGAIMLEAFSDVSRRIAGPLSSIIGASELLERNLSGAGGPTVDCVRRIKRNTNRVVRALDNLKRFRDVVS